MRTVVSRILLIGLLGVAVFAVVSLTSGPGQAIVALDGLNADDVEQDAFAVDGPATFAIEAGGSFEEAGTPGSDTTLAAYGWIVRREDGAVVWQMRPERPERGTLVILRDTVQLGAGTYDVYFTGHGDPLVRASGPRDGSVGERVRAFLSRGGRSWVGDAGRWRLILRPVDEAARQARTSGLGDGVERDDPLVVWEARGVRNRQRREGLFQVTDSARVTFRAVTEITDGVVRDVASVVRLGTGDTVWVARGPGDWAGGSLKNRVLEGRAVLEPGLYRASFAADRSHAYRRWSANPPFDPAAWGLSVRRASPEAAVGPLDPTALDLPLITSFECVGADEERRAIVTLPERTDVLLVAVGEIASGSEYDYATLEVSEGDGDWDELYEMGNDDREMLEWAGGDEKNRRAVIALTLEPGTYRLSYEADGSHDCVSGYNGDGGPDDPFWGVRMFALDPQADLEAILVRDVSAGPPLAASPPAALDLPDAARPLARIDSVRNSEDRRVRFTLAEAAEVRIVAQGEISDTDRYDFATLERPGGGVVWQMTWDNTQPGGESLFHRRFQGTVPLEAGTYVLHYRSDGSRSFGDFGPSSRRLWGVHVYAAETPTPPPPPPAPEATGDAAPMPAPEVDA